MTDEQQIEEIKQEAKSYYALDDLEKLSAKYFDRGSTLLESYQRAWELLLRALGMKINE